MGKNEYLTDHWVIEADKWSGAMMSFPWLRNIRSGTERKKTSQRTWPERIDANLPRDPPVAGWIATFIGGEQARQGQYGWRRHWHHA
jgi:hypothetical protein